MTIAGTGHAQGQSNPFSPIGAQPITYGPTPGGPIAVGGGHTVAGGGSVTRSPFTPTPVPLSPGPIVYGGGVGDPSGGVGSGITNPGGSTGIVAGIGTAISSAAGDIPWHTLLIGGGIILALYLLGPRVWGATKGVRKGTVRTIRGKR